MTSSNEKRGILYYNPVPINPQWAYLDPPQWGFDDEGAEVIYIGVSLPSSKDEYQGCLYYVHVHHTEGICHETFDVREWPIDFLPRRHTIVSRLLKEVRRLISCAISRDTKSVH